MQQKKLQGLKQKQKQKLKPDLTLTKNVKHSDDKNFV